MNLEVVVFTEPLVLFYSVCNVTFKKTVVLHVITEFNIQVVLSRVSIPASKRGPAI